jgi:hypothetical protein
MGAASLFGLTRGIELYLWIVIALIVAVVVARTSNQKQFLHGFLSGTGMGIANGIVQAFFLPIYLSHNPEAADQLNQNSFGFLPEVFIFLFSPLIGIVYGIVVGGFCAAAGKFHKPL